MTMNYSDFRLGKSSQHGYYVAAKYDERSTSYLAHGKTLEDVACDYGHKIFHDKQNEEFGWEFREFE